MPKVEVINKQIWEMEMKMEKKLQEIKDNEVKEEERRKAITHICRVPGYCPVGRCTEIVFPSNLMMHMLNKHSRNASITTSEVFEHKPCVVCFDPTGYEYGENQCVASLMYAGVKDQLDTLPGISYLSLPNTALIHDHHKFDNHLPIMMIGCRCSWYCQLKDKKLERELVALNANNSGIYVFWLVAPKTTRKLYYTLTVYDRHYLNSRSVIRTVRDYTNFQNPSDFLPNEDDYLVLRDSEVDEFLNIKTKKKSKKPPKRGIPMEIIVYENPSTTPIKHSSQKELKDAAEQVGVQYIKGTCCDHAKQTGKSSLKRNPCRTSAKTNSNLSA
ncbi:uncharacterized protein LOC132793088 [Drosophila nasuta]|uniref:uncharacterized protein LOC132793088 n=1 Tax=Drosophila nasuta TaxID=42062 RepID=UPI00295E960A|nr:uncharacterized protein LOC132793088 [Drosophila nasuta]